MDGTDEGTRHYNGELSVVAELKVLTGARPGWHSRCSSWFWASVRFAVGTRVALKNGIFWDVALVRTDVSEERTASINRMRRIGELGTKLAVTSNSVRLHSHRRENSDLT
jgi:hypothetical protein